MRSLLNCSIWFLVFHFGVCFGQGKKTEMFVRGGFKDSLLSIIKAIDAGKTVNAGRLEFCIPTSREECAIYYGQDYPIETSAGFRQMNQMILDAALGGDERILKAYLNLSQFVDGYPAEAYFENNITEIIKRQRELFCKTLKSLPKKNTTKLQDNKKQAGCH